MSARTAVAAVDLGAESGRVVRGEITGGGVTIEERHRFPNRPVTLPDRVAWDLTGIFRNVVDGLAAVPDAQSVGIDGWGVDIGLLRDDGSLTGLPRSYRDPHTAGILDELFALIPAATLFRRTGIQMMEINTLCQLLALRGAGSPELAEAKRLLLIPDLLQHWLGADAVCERTNASTTQMLGIDGDWATDVLHTCDLDATLPAPLVEPGTIIGAVRAGILDALPSRPALVAVASHDTASAVVGTPLESPRAVFLSSGTWSLVGMERTSPCINDAALACNLSNEVGAQGTVRLLRNVAGLWLVQRCRSAFAAADGHETSYAALTAMAERGPSLRTILDPDDPRLAHGGDLVAAVRDVCSATGQPVPDDRPSLLRALLEALALRYRWCIEALHAATGVRADVVHVVGGGSRNTLLCRLTAAATGLPVVAGPVEATAMGNVLVQGMAAGVVDGIADAHRLVARSTTLTRWEPDHDARWTEAYARFCALATVGGPPAVVAARTVVG